MKIPAGAVPSLRVVESQQEQANQPAPVTREQVDELVLALRDTTEAHRAALDQTLRAIADAMRKKPLEFEIRRGPSGLIESVVARPMQEGA